MSRGTAQLHPFCFLNWIIVLTVFVLVRLQTGGAAPAGCGSDVSAAAAADTNAPVDSPLTDRISRASSGQRRARRNCVEPGGIPTPADRSDSKTRSSESTPPPTTTTSSSSSSRKTTGRNIIRHTTTTATTPDGHRCEYALRDNDVDANIIDFNCSCSNCAGGSFSCSSSCLGYCPLDLRSGDLERTVCNCTLPQSVGNLIQVTCNCENSVYSCTPVNCSITATPTRHTDDEFRWNVHRLNDYDDYDYEVDRTTRRKPPDKKIRVPIPVACRMPGFKHARCPEKPDAGRSFVDDEHSAATSPHPSRIPWITLLPGSLMLLLHIAVLPTTL